MGARALICKGTSSGLSLCSYGLMAPACNSCNFGDNSSFLWALSFLLIGAQRFLKEELMSPKKESYISWSTSCFLGYVSLNLDTITPSLISFGILDGDRCIVSKGRGCVLSFPSSLLWPSSLWVVVEAKEVVNEGKEDNIKPLPPGKLNLLFHPLGHNSRSFLFLSYCVSES